VKTNKCFIKHFDYCKIFSDNSEEHSKNMLKIITEQSNAITVKNIKKFIKKRTNKMKDGNLKVSKNMPTHSQKQTHTHIHKHR